MQRITSESSVDEVLKQLGVGDAESLRESSTRERMLQKFAKLRSRNPDTTLSLKETPTAFVTIEEDEGKEFQNIVVTSKKFTQIDTDFPEDYHDYLLQKAFAFHEISHILYSSYPVLDDYIEKVKNEYGEDQYPMLFQNFYNALEDGAIENFAGSEFRIEEELYHLRRTMHEQNYMGDKIKGEEKWHYPFFFAILTALINLGVYDNGELEKLLDEDNEQHQFAPRGSGTDRDRLVELLPTMRTYIDDIQQERDVEKRMELCYELWEEVIEKVEESTTPGKLEMQRRMDEEDEDSYLPGIPENLSEDHGDSEEKPSEGSGGDGGESLAERRKEIPDENVAERAERGVKQEIQEQADNWEDELEEIINGLEGGEGVDEIYIPEDGEVLTHRKKKAEAHGKRCARIFKRRLRRAQRDKVVTGKTRGKHIDGRRLMRTERGKIDIFEQKREGKKKNYSCMIVCDRSGSMSDYIDDVELAAGAVAYGLEEVGVDVSLLDTYNSKTTLAKPFGGDVDDFAEKLFANRVSGGTPLRYTLRFARSRIVRGANDLPFMIVITDGRPAQIEATKEEIKKSQFPVLGIYLNGKNDVSDQLKLYDSAISVSNDEDVGQALINLINSIIF